MSWQLSQDRLQKMSGDKRVLPILLPDGTQCHADRLTRLPSQP